MKQMTNEQESKLRGFIEGQLQTIKLYLGARNLAGMLGTGHEKLRQEVKELEKMLELFEAPAKDLVLKSDLSEGEDIRGDEALFIDISHIWQDQLDEDTKEALKHLGSIPIFFRLLKNGVQLHQHGWIENGQIVQWG